MKSWLHFPLSLPVALLLGVQVSAAASPSKFYVSPSKEDAHTADVGIDKRGNAVFTWTTFDQDSGDVIVQLRKRTEAGKLADPETLSKTGHDAFSAHVAVSANGGAVAVWQIRSGDASATTPVQGRARTAGGKLGPIFTVDGHPGGEFSFEFAYPSVGIDAEGGAVFAWTGRDDGENRGFARTRSAGGKLGPILKLSPMGAANPKMAVNAKGAAVFTWVRNDGAGSNLIEARIMSSNGKLGPIRIMGAGLEGGGGGAAGTWNPYPAIDGEGNALIVWEQPDGDGPCGINGCPNILGRSLSNDSVLGAVPEGFSTTDSGAFSPQAAMDAKGNALVIWLNSGVEARERSAKGKLGPVEKLSKSSDGNPPLIRGDTIGNTITVWQDSGSVRARSRSAKGKLGPTRTFSIGGQPTFGGVPAIASGNAVVAWEQSDGTTDCFGGTACSRIGAAVDP